MTQEAIPQERLEEVIGRDVDLHLHGRVPFRARITAVSPRNVVYLAGRRRSLRSIERIRVIQAVPR